MNASGGSAPDFRNALIAGVGCYVVWGLSPLIYQPMGRAGADAFEIMGHRAIWSVLWAGLLVLLARQSGDVKRVLRSPRTLALLLVSTSLIAVNWAVFVWAVNNGHTLETSLGYYLNPLLNMAAGAWIFRERISGLGLAAIALAVVGVALQAVAVGGLPWVSLTLGLTFAAYGVIRKRIDADAQTGLFIECALITLPGIAYILWLESQGLGHFTDSTGTALLLMLAGPVTVVPLMLFSWAARRMPLSTMGFLQFLAPTISFVIGVAQGEPFGWLRALSFGFIWAGAMVFVLAALQRSRAARAQRLA
ncbi:MAG: EamA family transporter RarD [Brevundimonas sp.]|uniref:EamA family transporter RarD n=1 Tax=Brevundimonas sp. TaxID=1871086 RepID=UPI003918D8BD